jgi:hypothetical protein
MTIVDVQFRYGASPTESGIRAINALWEVYGIRRIQLDEQQKIVRVEYDASRLSEEIVAGLLRRAGVDLREKLAMA